jgi:hypothetical protein
MKRHSTAPGLLLATLALACLAIWPAESLAISSGSGTLSLTAPGTPVTVDFDTLANAGTSSALPTGIRLEEIGTSPTVDGNYAADNGGSNLGESRSYGTTASTERALGAVQSGTSITTIGASVTNATGGAITALNVSYTGEQWRLGMSGRADQLAFQYSLDATGLTSGTWSSVAALNFNSPATTGAAGALDGNVAANRTNLATTLTGLSIPNGATFFIRWNDIDAAGPDDGLAVDDLSVKATAVNGAPVLAAIGDRSVAEGAALQFTVAATDPEGDPLAYSASNLPPGASFDPATHAFSWTPGAGQAGAYPGVHFAVTDGRSTDSEDVTIAVSATPPGDQGGGGSGSDGGGAGGGTVKSATSTSVSAKASGKRVKVSGTVLPAQPGGTVQLTLMRSKQHGKPFKTIRTATATLDLAGSFAANLKRKPGGKCRLKAEWAGDPDSLPSEATSGFHC